MDDEIWALLQLKARYFRFMDTKQWALWRGLFTDDMVFYMEDSALPQTQEPITTSGDDFVEYVSELLTSTVTVHHGHMPELELTGEGQARGIWAMYDFVQTGGDLGTFMGYGHYHEDYEKGADGQWRIKVLRLTRLRVDPVTADPPGGERPLPGPWKRSVPSQ